MGPTSDRQDEKWLFHIYFRINTSSNLSAIAADVSITRTISRLMSVVFQSSAKPSFISQLQYLSERVMYLFDALIRIFHWLRAHIITKKGVKKTSPGDCHTGGGVGSTWNPEKLSFVRIWYAITTVVCRYESLICRHVRVWDVDALKIFFHLFFFFLALRCFHTINEDQMFSCGDVPSKLKTKIDQKINKNWIMIFHLT